MSLLNEIQSEIGRMSGGLIGRQHEDGSWRFACENGIATDSYLIVTLRSLELEEEPLIRQLAERILAAQHPDGSWKLYENESGGSLDATVEAYYALRFAGCGRTAEEPLRKAEQFIRSRGGIRQLNNILTRTLLAVTGQAPWPSALSIPLEALLLPPEFPVQVFDLSAYARVHLIPMLILSDRKFVIWVPGTPDLSSLAGSRTDTPAPGAPETGPDGPLHALLEEMKSAIGMLTNFPGKLHEEAVARAEQFMLKRIEPDGTLYSYTTSTFLMIFALLALGYDKKHEVITRAVNGLLSMLWHSRGTVFLQNAPSTVWDTALLSYALQEAGGAEVDHAARRASAYILARQQHTLGDWTVHNPNPVPGGWGFSESNTLNPDVDDTAAALRAIRFLSHSSPAYRSAWNRGLNWLLSMQNADGGWPAFERQVNNTLLAWLPIDGAKAAATDPSTPDLTGRTLHFLGNSAGLHTGHAFIRKGTDWLIGRQEADGSWYGRWGVCYIYGTWAALTGLLAAGVKPGHPAVQRGIRWLLRIQNPDGGWGESCSSDHELRYVPLGASTPSQTAWALDALIAAHSSPTPALDRGMRRLLKAVQDEDGWTAVYPTGAGLPGRLYIHYHSYRHIWPLLTLSHYNNKYG